MEMADPGRTALTDALGRRISYLRISVTDRCDLRCRYCMAERMTFLPRDQILTLEEIALLADLFIARGVRRIRLTGGEPLVRRDIIDLVRRIGRHVGAGLDEQIGRAHVRTPVTNAHLVCRLLLEKKKKNRT